MSTLQITELAHRLVEPNVRNLTVRRSNAHEQKVTDTFKCHFINLRNAGVGKDHLHQTTSCQESPVCIRIIKVYNKIPINGNTKCIPQK